MKNSFQLFAAAARCEVKRVSQDWAFAGIKFIQRHVDGAIRNYSRIDREIVYESRILECDGSSASCITGYSEKTSRELKSVILTSTPSRSKEISSRVPKLKILNSQSSSGFVLQPAV